MSAERVMAEIRGDLSRRLEACGFAIEGEVRRRTPVDTGRLRSSIAHEADENEVVVGTNVHYAKYVELGTRRQNAQPYLVPGVVSAKPAIKRILGA